MDHYELSQYAAPEGNRPDSVSTALKAAWAARDQASAEKAASQLLHAIGNSHAGTYFPVAVALVSAMIPLLVAGNPWARQAGLEVLSDLSGSFQPEPGFEQMTLIDGTSGKTADILSKRIEELSPALKLIQASDDALEESRALAAEISEAIFSALW